MRRYILFVIAGNSGFERTILAEHCEADKNGCYIFYNREGVDREKKMVATYPIGRTIIEKFEELTTNSTTPNINKLTNLETSI